MLSCEFYEISKNTFFTAHVWATASTNSYIPWIYSFKPLLPFSIVFPRADIRRGLFSRQTIKPRNTYSYIGVEEVLIEGGEWDHGSLFHCSEIIAHIYASIIQWYSIISFSLLGKVKSNQQIIWAKKGLKEYLLYFLNVIE